MEDFHKQESIFNPLEFDEEVTIIGAGSIGSFVNLSLTKMGLNTSVWDFDVLEEHNIPNQFYRLEDIGRHKIEALNDIVNSFSNRRTKIRDIKVDETTDLDELKGIVISAVDSMKVRKIIWEKCKFNINLKAFIDSRMGGEVMKIYTINPNDMDDIELYESTLHTDEEASTDTCSVQTIIYNILVVSGFIANQVKKVLKIENFNKEIIFDLKTMTLLKR